MHAWVFMVSSTWTFDKHSLFSPFINTFNEKFNLTVWIPLCLCVIGLNHCQPWVNPMHCGLCSAVKVQQARLGAHCVYFYRYKSKYSTTNIQFFLSKFQKFSPAHVQNNVRYKNCVQHKQKAKKQKRGEYNSLLTHFICRVNIIMIVSMFTWV